MKRLFLLIFLFSTSRAFCQDVASIVINEINCDNPGGPDTQEFIEFFGSPNALLDSLVIVFYDGTSGQSYAAFDLDGYTLDENGFFVIGNANTLNVDLVFGNATFQNGQDGVAIYNADEIDFPNGSAPSSNDIIDAAVYGTADATATNLIVGLGLDSFVPGYVQLDETVQQSGTDLSISRLPDGGNAFENSTFVLQEITPGFWNQPLCAAGAVTNENFLSTITLCDNLESHIEHFIQDDSAYGDSFGFVITSSSGEIIEVLPSDSFNFAGLTQGLYLVYSFAYTGILQTETTLPGLPFDQMLANACISFTTNPVAVTVTSCGGCIGGEISDQDSNTSIAFCAAQQDQISMITTSTSQDADYLYILTDLTNIVIDTFHTTLNTSTLLTGNYLVHGLSFIGSIDPAMLLAGADVAFIAAETCSEFSSNTYQITVFNCNANEPCNTVFISEYLEGNNGTKAIELFNPTLLPVDLAEYSIFIYANGSLTPSSTLQLSGSIDPLGTFVIANPGTGNGNGLADPIVLALADVLDVVANFSGNDAIELRLNETVIDVIGMVGEDPGNQSGWPVGAGSTRNFDLVRKPEIQSPMNIWELSETQWIVNASTDYSYLGNHSFNTCASDVLAGFATSSISVNENDGILSIQIQSINVTTPITLQVSVMSGSAGASDYTITSPVSFTFDGTNISQLLSLELIDDIELENDETIILSLSSADLVTWLTQTLTITILANDPNCDGGTIALISLQGPVNQCADLTNTPIDIAYNTTMTEANYAFVVTNSTNAIVEILSNSPLNLDANGVGTFRIWGLSYTGTLNEDSIQVGASVLDIASDSCASLSSNFITVIRSACTLTGCNAGDVMLEDGTEIISICADSEMTLTMQNTGASVNDQYHYVLTDLTDTIISISEGTFFTSMLAIGNYHIYGISHLGDLISTTTSVGLPLSEILSNGCIEFTSNSVEVIVHDCSTTPSCTYLFFSEYLEDSQSNKALELYNPTNGDIDLSDYSIRMYSNGSITPSFVLEPVGILSSQDVFLIVSSGNGQSQTAPEILAFSDTLHEVATFSGNDAIELVWQETVVDVIGVIGEDPGNQGWLFGNTGAANHDLVRRNEVISPNSNWPIVTGQWLSFEPTDYSHLGAHDALNCESSLIPSAGFVNVSTSVLENAGTIQLELQAFDIINPTSIVINEIGGTAENGVDFNSTWPVIVQFPSGNSTQTFSIEILPDMLDETDETILLGLSSDQINQWINTESTITIVNVLSVTESEKGTMEIFPNPGDDCLNIRTNSKTDAWRIMDMDGRIVQEGGTLGLINFKIDTEDIANGTYVLECFTDNKIQLQRFIVMHTQR